MYPGDEAITSLRAEPRRGSEGTGVGRTVRALEILAERSVSPSTLAQELNVHPRTALRMLRRLQDSGYAVMTEAGAYAATFKLVLVAQRLSSRAAFADVAIPVMTRVRDELDERVHLCIAAQGGVVEMLCIGPAIADRTDTASSTVPFHCTAVGKAVLSQSPDWRGSVEAVGLPRMTAQTLADPSDLDRELRRVRRCGYAVDDRENNPNLRCVAVPVQSPQGLPAAAIGVSGRVERLGARRVLRMAEVLRDAAAQIGPAVEPREKTPVGKELLR